ncbi:MAG: FtsX-like permease family protein [Hyphomicrobiaceae bacterium]|nr:MAG: FtsX-like permease family protein [Hyphomicrobiaceae bacterium]
MRALDRKLLRDLRRMWAQALAIALVMASGAATFVLASGAYRSLDETRRSYYERYRFGEVFADIRRAPKTVEEQILAISGVAAAEARISRLALLDIEGLAEPATGQAISVPDMAEQRLNRLHLRAGRLPERERTDEVTVNEAFAKAHKLQLGSTFKAVLNGKKRELKIVGIALSPEFIYALGPGDLMPDDRRFAVLWMSEKALAALFDLDGAFNSVSLRLLRGAVEADVIEKLDSLLARYGGTGAYSRRDQLSHAFLDAELKQLDALRRVMPPIFLLVSAFLINMTLMRMIALEREQIGLLKAIGYGPLPIAAHYIKFVLAIALVGISIGFLIGVWLGQGLTRLYADFFHFPFLIFQNDADIFATAGIVCVVAAVAGAIRAVVQILALAPAVAMQPPAPPRYRRWFSGRVPASIRPSQLTIMALRHISRWPVRAGLTSLGISLGIALLITALLSFDSVDLMIDVAFFRTDRQHATLNFTDDKHSRALQAVERLPGVLRAEPYRAVAVRLRNGHLSRKLGIVGKPKEMDLSRVLDVAFQPVQLPETGLMVDERVAEILQLRRGDLVEVELLEGRRGIRLVPVTEVIKSYLGLMAFMDIDALHDLMDDGPRVTGVHIAYDARKQGELFAAIKSTPALGSIGLQQHALSRFRETIAQNINYMVTIYVVLAVIIAFGVVYNSARIQLSEHAREIASLRVLGFTRAEVSRVLLTELAVLTIVAVPLGWIIGYGFGWLLIKAFSSDLYRVPFAIERATYAKASLVVLAATAVSALIVRRRVDKLDLIAVLKTRD